MDQKPILSVENLQKLYGDCAVINDLNFSLYPGEVVGLLGPNGAGKTTLFHILLGFLKQTQGDIFLHNEEISHLATHKRTLLGIGYLPQESSIFQSLTVKENILCVLETFPFSKKERMEKLHNVLEQMHITTLKDKKGKYLSGGEKRRVEIARLLVCTPNILLLDEPFANIDPITIAEVKNIIQMLSKKGITIFITDHNAREICTCCSRCYILANGNIIAEGPTDTILENPDARAKYFGKAFSL